MLRKTLNKAGRGRRHGRGRRERGVVRRFERESERRERRSVWNKVIMKARAGENWFSAFLSEAPMSWFW